MFVRSGILAASILLSVTSCAAPSLEGAQRHVMPLGQTSFAQYAADAKAWIGANRSFVLDTDEGRKMELEAKIRQKEAEEKAERRAIEAMTELMDDPDERLTIQLKYLDRAEWPDVTFALYGNRPDFADKADAYQRRMYRVHGRALLSLAEIEAEVNDSK